MTSVGSTTWMPGVDACRVEGDTRILEVFGMEITERLVRRDDAARRARILDRREPAQHRLAPRQDRGPRAGRGKPGHLARRGESRPLDGPSRRDLPAGTRRDEGPPRSPGTAEATETGRDRHGEDVEFAVVGGGLLGLATARELARRGREVLSWSAPRSATKEPGPRGARVCSVSATTTRSTSRWR